MRSTPARFVMPIVSRIYLPGKTAQGGAQRNHLNDATKALKDVVAPHEIICIALALPITPLARDSP